MIILPWYEQQQGCLARDSMSRLANSNECLTTGVVWEHLPFPSSSVLEDGSSGHSLMDMLHWSEQGLNRDCGIGLWFGWEWIQARV